MRRLAEPEMSAHFTLLLLIGHNMYPTGNLFPVSGSFNDSGKPINSS